MEHIGKKEVETRSATRGVILHRYRIIIPLVISVLSIAFGVFQYLDKRTTQAELDRVSLDLGRHELVRAERTDHAGLQVNRLMIKCGDILRKHRPTDSESWNRGLVRFIAELDSIIPYRHPRLIEDSNYEQLSVYIGNSLERLRAGTFADSGSPALERLDPGYVSTIHESEQLYHILGEEKLEFIVLGNTGGSPAEEIRGRDSAGRELFSISVLEPDASILHVSALGNRLELNQMIEAEYIDTFTGKKKYATAWKGVTATTIAPNIGWAD